MNKDEYEFIETPREEQEAAQLAHLLEMDAAIMKHMAKQEARKNMVSLEECVECGEPIPEARRNAVPGVTMCIECANLSEKPW